MVEPPRKPTQWSWQDNANNDVILSYSSRDVVNYEELVHAFNEQGLVSILANCQANGAFGRMKLRVVVEQGTTSYFAEVTPMDCEITSVEFIMLIEEIGRRESPLIGLIAASRSCGIGIEGKMIPEYELRKANCNNIPRMLAEYKRSVAMKKNG